MKAFIHLISLLSALLLSSPANAKDGKLTHEERVKKIGEIKRAIAKEPLDKSVIKEKFGGVRFYLKLPPNHSPEKGECAGVVITIPYVMQHGLVNRHIGLEASATKDLLEKGYAHLCWSSPAQPQNLGDPKNVDSCYGVNESDCSPEMKAEREKRWGSWLPKIDTGIQMLVEKYKIPANGYLATSSCLSSERLSRYIGYKPERFSAHIALKPQGLYSSNAKTKHIFTALCNKPYEPHESVMRRFGYECHRNGSPYSIIFLKDRMEEAYTIRPVAKKLLDYVVSHREKLNLKGTLTPKQLLNLSNSIASDLDSSPYYYDYLDGKLGEDSKDNLLSFEGFICKIPNKELAKMSKGSSHLK